MAEDRNGWTGRDNRVRQIRTLAAVWFLVLISVVVFDHRADVGTLGLLVGGLLVDIGFEVGLRYPGGGMSRKEEPE